jgi:hypothetical protein
MLTDLIDVNRSPSGVDLRYSENNLRIGQVSNIYHTDSDQNYSKQYVEYEVTLFRTNANKTNTPVTVRCVTVDLFGSVADKMSFTPRKSTAFSSGNAFSNVGSMVLVLCVDSDLHQGVIVGGYPNNNLPTLKQNLGHHLSFEFNGVRFNIDKDGQVAVKRRGPTNDDGAVVSGQETNGGATVLMTSDGSVSIQSGNGNEVKVDLDATNGSLNLTCTEGVVINSGGYSMVRGETIRDSVATLVQGVINALAAVPAGGPNSAAVVPASNVLAQFKADTSFLSTKNKVD